MTQTSVLKSRDITLLTTTCIVKAMIFPVVMYGCESWTIKKAERWRFDAFKLWCWRESSRVPWTARRSNQSILKEINPEYSLEGLMLKLKLQYFGHLMRRADSSEMNLILGKIEGRIRHALLTDQEQTLESFLKGDSISFCWVTVVWRIRCRYLRAVMLKVAWNPYIFSTFFLW